jgi:hypothetical protein
VAALEAAALDKLLQRQRQQQQGKGAQGGNLHQQLQAAMLPTIQAAWDMAVGADMAYACASSNDPALAKTGPLARAMQGYMQCVFAACGRDLQVGAGLPCGCVWVMQDSAASQALPSAVMHQHAESGAAPLPLSPTPLRCHGCRCAPPSRASSTCWQAPSP